jgi:hypothetical protein
MLCPPEGAYPLRDFIGCSRTPLWKVLDEVPTTIFLFFSCYIPKG